MPAPICDHGEAVDAARALRRRCCSSAAATSTPERYGAEPRPSRSTASIPLRDEFELALLRAALELGAADCSRSAAARRCSTSRSAARSTSTSPTRRPPRPRHARASRAARRCTTSRSSRARGSAAAMGATHADVLVATTTRPSTASATGCASRRGPPTASSRASSSTATAWVIGVAVAPRGHRRPTIPAQQGLFDAFVPRDAVPSRRDRRPPDVSRPSGSRLRPWRDDDLDAVRRAVRGPRGDAVARREGRPLTRDAVGRADRRLPPALGRRRVRPLVRGAARTTDECIGFVGLAIPRFLPEVLPARRDRLAARPPVVGPGARDRGRPRDRRLRVRHRSGSTGSSASPGPRTAAPGT